MGRRNDDDSPSVSSQLSQTTRQGVASFCLSLSSGQVEPHSPGADDVLRILVLGAQWPQRPSDMSCRQWVSKRTLPGQGGLL